MDSKARFEQLIAKLRTRSCRLTPQRVALVKILAAGTGHPSATQIYEQMRRRFPTTTLATVYKILALLKETGEVLELEFSGAENRYDGKKPYPHPHLICVRCNKIADPKVDALDQVPACVSRSTGYKIVGHRFDIYGICPQCQRKSIKQRARIETRHPRKESAS